MLWAELESLARARATRLLFRGWRVEVELDAREGRGVELGCTKVLAATGDFAVFGDAFHAESDVVAIGEPGTHISILQKAFIVFSGLSLIHI